MAVYDTDYPDEIAVDWCVTARVKGKGKPLTCMTTGDGLTATAAMIAWLEGSECNGSQLTVTGDNVSIEIECDLTSDQVPGGSENFRFACSGLPVPASLVYAKEWLAAVGTLMGWGGGGS